MAAALVLAGGVGACGSDDETAGDADDNAATTTPGDVGTTPLGGAAERGQEVAEDSGCGGCHQVGSEGIGPDWRGLYGSTVTLEDGSTVVADDAYLALAITDPDAQVVDGYDVRMPSRDMSDEDLASVVAYIRELGPGGVTTTDPR